MTVLTGDWRCDQYRWVNQGVHKLPKTDPQVKKSYFRISLPDGPSNVFIKHAYNLLPPSDNMTTVIHYLGDEKAAVPFPHGNATTNSQRSYVRTCPSVLKTLEEECKVATPIKAYRDEITKVPPSTHLSVKQPRNIKQVKNIRCHILEDFRLSHDGIINLHELAIDLPDFIHSIHTHPDLICICGHKVLFNELDRVLLVDSPSAQLLSYDTTFQLGDFYVSVLSFRHVLFKECPAIPVGIVLHERKYQSVHDQFFDVCCKLAPGLKSTTNPIVTDEEQGIVNTIASHLQSSTNLQCWNHVFCDAMR